MDKNYEQTFLSQIEELEKRIKAASKLAVNKQQIDEMEAEIQSLKQSLQNLSEVATTGSYNDLLDLPTLVEGGQDNNWLNTSRARTTNFFGTYAYPNEYVSGRFYFICSPDDYEIEGTISVEIRYKSDGMTAADHTMNVKINDENVSTIFGRIPSSGFGTLTGDLSFRPKKASNYFTFDFVTTGIFWVAPLKFSFNITNGKNVFFLSRDYSWIATIFEDRYYLSHNIDVYETPLYTVTNDNFVFDTPYTVRNYAEGCQSVGPYINYLDGNLYPDYNYILLISRYTPNNSFRILMGPGAGSLISTSASIADGWGITYFKELTTNHRTFALTGIFGTNRVLAYYQNVTLDIGLQYRPYKLNDVEVEGNIWVENIAVQQNKMLSAPFNTFQGSVAVREDGMCVFFPYYYTDYTLELGVGRHPNAYRQINGDINVYIGRINHTVKKVLRKNLSTSRFEIIPEEEKKYYGTEMIFEGYDGKGIFMIDGNIWLADL